MKRAVISTIAFLSLAVAASGVLRSHEPIRPARGGMPSIAELPAGQASRLPEQEIEDCSVLFVKEPAR